MYTCGVMVIRGGFKLEQTACEASSNAGSASTARMPPGHSNCRVDCGHCRLEWQASVNANNGPAKCIQDMSYNARCQNPVFRKCILSLPLSMGMLMITRRAAWLCPQSKSPGEWQPQARSHSAASSRRHLHITHHAHHTPTHVPLRVQSVPVVGGVNVLVDTAM